MSDGHNELWAWFGLSYAAWLTLPRVLMHAMPDEWQADMARLLKEYDAAFPNLPLLGTSVSAKDAYGHFVRMPEWVGAYRHPDHDAIDELRQPWRSSR